MAIHDEVLRAARRLCRERRAWTFSAEEVVRALPGLNESSVRTHVVSRCCVNAPKNMSGLDVYKRMRQKGIELAKGYGSLKDSTFRVGNMGYIRPEDINEMLQKLGEVLK